MATPFTAFTVRVPPRVALPLARAAVTASELVVTTLPFASRSSSTGWAAKAAPLVTVLDGGVTSTSCVGVPTVPVALKVTGLPVRPAAVAVTLFAPAVVPSVHEVSVATPLAFVLTLPPLAGTVLPPPLATVKVTDTPLTGLPPASVTRTLGGALTAVPAGALCVVVDTAAIVLAAPAFTVMVPDVIVSTGDAVVNSMVCAPVPSPPNDKFVNVATPFTAFTVRVPPRVALPVARAAVTASVEVVTTLPFASRSSSTGWAAKAAPLVTVLDGGVTSTSCVGAPTVPVALKVTGLPVRPAAVAVTLLAPAVPPRVHDVSAATPLAFVLTLPPLAGTVLPPPLATVKVTDTPLTGLPPASVTRTLGGAPTAVPAGALCVVVDSAEMVLAAPVFTVMVPEVIVSAGVVVVNSILCAPVPRPPNDRLVNVATPFTAFTVSVPPSVALPLARAAVTANELVVTRLPFTSRSSSTGCAAKATPLVTVLDGGVTSTSCVGAPTVPVALKVTGLPVRPAAVAVTLFAPAVLPERPRRECGQATRVGAHDGAAGRTGTAAAARHGEGHRHATHRVAACIGNAHARRRARR